MPDMVRMVGWMVATLVLLVTRIHTVPLEAAFQGMAVMHGLSYHIITWHNIHKGEWSVAERTTFMEYLCNERS